MHSTRARVFPPPPSSRPLQFQDWRIERASHASYIWDVNSPNEPEMALHPVASLCCLDAYNPKCNDLLVGGLYNGLVSFWDTRKGPNPVETSVIECSHRDPVYDICWLAGKTATDCVSTSTDGQVLYSPWLCLPTRCCGYTHRGYAHCGYVRCDCTGYGCTY